MWKGEREFSFPKVGGEGTTLTAHLRSVATLTFLIVHVPLPDFTVTIGAPGVPKNHSLKEILISCRNELLTNDNIGSRCKHHPHPQYELICLLLSNNLGTCIHQHCSLILKLPVIRQTLITRKGQVVNESAIVVKDAPILLIPCRPPIFIEQRKQVGLKEYPRMPWCASFGGNMADQT